MDVALFFDAFIIFSFVGWVYECTYCTCKGGHWQNRGFLYGPICPIYGSGVVAALVVFKYLPIPMSGSGYSIWQIFLICAVGSAIIEYVTSWVLELLFHARWWDYSTVPLNINGRVSLPTTCGFGLAGIVVVRYLFPFLNTLPTAEHPIINEILSIAFAIVLGMDLALTVASLTSILERMDNFETEFNGRMESGVQTIQQGPAAVASVAKDVAKDAGETAAIAAMLATDAVHAQASNAGQEMSDRVRSVVDSLSVRDRYHLQSIKVYRPIAKKGERPDTVERLKGFFSSLQTKAREREVTRK